MSFGNCIVNIMIRKEKVGQTKTYMIPLAAISNKFDVRTSLDEWLIAYSEEDAIEFFTTSGYYSGRRLRRI